MKPLSSFILVLSIVANLALAGLLWKGSVEASARAAARTAAELSDAESTQGRSTSAADKSATPELWTQLQSADLASQQALLAEAGFPRHMTRAILAGRLREIYDAERRRAEPETEARPYWKNFRRDPAIDIALRKLSWEHTKLLNELAGPDEGEGADYRLERALASLPGQKAAEVKRVFADFRDKQMDLFTSGPVIGVDQKKMAELIKTRDQALATILTAQELEEYQLRAGDLANQLRWELAAFEPTEQEFRTLHRIRQAYAESPGMSHGGGGSMEEMRKREDMRKAMQQEIDQALGPGRAAEYSRATDYGYRQTAQLVDRLRLPRESVNQVWSIQEDITRRMESLHGSGSASQEQVQAGRAALLAEAKARVTGILGASGWEAYQHYGGTWLRSLDPPKPTPGS
jgi:hypothetical protein